jgi:hypothetical protein
MIAKLGVKDRRALAKWEDNMEQTNESLRCYFCRKDSAAVEYLIAGRDGYICGDCVEKANAILADARKK